MDIFSTPIGDKDPECGRFETVSFDNPSIITEKAIHIDDFYADDTWYTKLQRAAGKLGVEERGIERVPSDERTDTSASKMATVWLSCNMVVSSFAVGAIGITIFHLGFVEAALTIFFINVLSILPNCFFATFGPRFGLRQMVLSRFYFGYYGVKIAAMVNVIICIGWSSVNVIVGAQLFHAINSDMPGWAGILIIAILTLIICVFGYRIVHVYERYAWIPIFIIFLIVLGQFAHSGEFDTLLPLRTGTASAGSVLSFAGAIYGFGSGWCVVAADYTVYQPVSRSGVSVFFWTFSGLIFPLLFAQLLGAAVATATVHNPEFQSNYAESGIGGLFSTVLIPPFGRFGEFCLAILALSITANNCPNIYSVSLSLQVLAQKTQNIPRFVWTCIATGMYIAISIPGYDRFHAWLENFMLIIAYWLGIYEGIALSEHFVFRRGFGGYVPEDYTNPSALPPGIAATLAICFGILGTVLGMSQVWFTGPISKLAGNGDIGFELAFGVSSVVYIALRAVEKSYFGR
ncbi:purine-cytosine permease [Rhypophila sp. PSN 637]